MANNKRTFINELKREDYNELVIIHLGKAYTYKYDKKDDALVRQYLSHWRVIKTHKSSNYYYAGFTKKLDNGKRGFVYLHRHLAGVKPCEDKTVKLLNGVYDLRSANLVVIDKSINTFKGVEKIYNDNNETIGYKATLKDSNDNILASKTFMLSKYSETSAILSARYFVLMAEVEYNESFKNTVHTDIHTNIIDYQDVSNVINK